jgi:hypothetical protein
MLLMLAGTSVHAECAKATAPNLPDGNTASMEEMVAGQKAVKEFIAEGTAYQGCLDAEEAAAGEDEAPEAKAARLAHYNSVATEQEAVAAEFNAAIKAFKARQ